MSTGWRATAFAAALVALPSAGCEVEQCKEGEPGCLNGEPDDSNNCRYGLVARSGKCIVKNGRVDSGDGGQDAGEQNDCGCEEGQELCTSSGACTQVCTVPSDAPAKKPVAQTCRPVSGQAAYDFVTAATAACYQECIHRAELCGTACDPTRVCERTAAVAALLVRCPGNNVECAMSACEQARDLPCAQQVCPGNATPNCTGVRCTNSCTTTSGNFVFDGVCDDGDFSNGGSSFCEWGADCGDCGPRRGTPPPKSVPIGGLCVDPVQCGADFSDFRRSLGWCLPYEDNSGRNRCLPDCVDQGCADPGFECSSIVIDEDGAAGPLPQRELVDGNDTVARACFPSFCGS